MTSSYFTIMYLHFYLKCNKAVKLNLLSSLQYLVMQMKSCKLCYDRWRLKYRIFVKHYTDRILQIYKYKYYKTNIKKQIFHQNYTQLYTFWWKITMYSSKKR